MPLGRRRPLLRGAIVGGAAYRAGQRRQQGQTREEEQEARLQQLEQQQQPVAVAPPPAPAPAPAAGGGPADMIEQLTQLGRLRDSGVLTDAEFEQQKQRLLTS